MEEKKKHLPIYGIGPFYGAFVILISIIFVLLWAFGVLDIGNVEKLWAIIIFISLGAIFIGLGLVIWIPCAFGKHCIDIYIKENKLRTDGVYSYVRNPCYTGITFIVVGIDFMFLNLFALILPFLYWLTLTVTMKLTEEKWLLKTYGKQYQIYMKQVNRCIPWIKRKI